MYIQNITLMNEQSTIQPEHICLVVFVLLTIEPERVLKLFEDSYGPAAGYLIVCTEGCLCSSAVARLLHFTCKFDAFFRLLALFLLRGLAAVASS